MEANYQLASDLFHLCILSLTWWYDSPSWKYTTAIYLYKSATDSCMGIINHMITGRSCCFTSLLPDNQLMVMGGHTDGGVTDAVELATVCHYN